MKGDTYNKGDLTGFRFALYAKGNDMPLQTAVSDAAGNYVFDIMKYTKPGTYQYTVKEIDTGVEHVRYDDTVYNITVDVGHEDGKVKLLDVKITIGRNALTQFISGILDDISDDILDFTNEYDEPGKPVEPEKPDEPEKPKTPGESRENTVPANTGDSANPILWSIVLILAAACVVAAIWKRKNKK